MNKINFYTMFRWYSVRYVALDCCGEIITIICMWWREFFIDFCLHSLLYQAHRYNSKTVLKQHKPKALKTKGTPNSHKAQTQKREVSTAQRQCVK